jgi:branched-chain amino acid transport system ATP-binding protein
MNLLEVRNIRCCFGGLVALDQVGFAVAPGRIKALIGPNGAGKTTLFNIVSGLVPFQNGDVLFKNHPIGGLKPFRIARRGIARTFQNPSLFLKMSVLENVMVGRHVRSRSGFLASTLRAPSQMREESAIRDAAMQWLKFVGLERLAATPTGALAFGQLRMVELARALAAEPELLMLDEPASGMNNRETENLSALIRAIRDRGVTILLVEHDMSMVMDISDEIVVLDHGRWIAEGPPAAVQNDPQVISVYLGGEPEHVASGN